jgi:hypothetical protein
MKNLCIERDHKYVKLSLNIETFFPTHNKKRQYFMYKTILTTYRNNKYKPKNNSQKKPCVHNPLDVCGNKGFSVDFYARFSLEKL